MASRPPIKFLAVPVRQLRKCERGEARTEGRLEGRNEGGGTVMSLLLEMREKAARQEEETVDASENSGEITIGE